MEKILQYFSDNLVLGIVVVSVTLVLFVLTLLLALNSKKTIFINETLEAREKGIKSEEKSVKEDKSSENDEPDSSDLDKQIEEIENQIKLTGAQAEDGLLEGEKITHEILDEDKDIDGFTNSINYFEIGDGKLGKEDEKFIADLDKVEKINEDELDEGIDEDDVDEVKELEEELKNITKEPSIEDTLESESKNITQDIDDDSDDDYFETDEVKSYGEEKKENGYKYNLNDDKEDIEDEITTSHNDLSEDKNVLENENDINEDDDQEHLRSENKYIVYFDSSINKWVVKKENADRVSKKLTDRQKAIEYVRMLTSRYGGTYTITRKNNKKG